MSNPLTLTFLSTLAFGLQFLIFVYLYSSHRVRFFHYLLWAWGFFTLSKGLKLLQVMAGGLDLARLMDASGMLAVLCLFAAALAYRDRARSEMCSLKELNERLVDDLGEGLQLVDVDFSIRHRNRWMLEQFGPITGRRCYEVLVGDDPR